MTPPVFICERQTSLGLSSSTSRRRSDLPTRRDAHSMRHHALWAQRNKITDSSLGSEGQVFVVGAIYAYRSGIDPDAAYAFAADVLRQKTVAVGEKQFAHGHLFPESIITTEHRWGCHSNTSRTARSRTSGLTPSPSTNGVSGNTGSGSVSSQQEKLWGRTTAAGSRSPSPKA